MAPAREQRNGRFEEAMTNLLQSQAALVQSHATLAQSQATLAQNQAAFLARVTEMDQRWSELERINAERFARIEAILMEHTRILDDHGRILQALTDAIRELVSRVPNNGPQLKANDSRASPLHRVRASSAQSSVTIADRERQSATAQWPI